MNYRTCLHMLWVIFISLNLTAQESNETLVQFQELVMQVDQLGRVGHFEEAITKGEEAREFAKTNSIDKNLLRNVLYKLSILYRKTNNVEKEHEIYSEMNSIRKVELQEENESFGKVFEDLKNYTARSSSITSSLQVLSKMNNNLLSHVDNSFKYRFSEEKKLFIDHNVVPFFELYQSLAYRTKYKFNSLTNIAADNSMNLKGLLLNSSRDILMGLSQLNDPKIDVKIANYRKEKSYINLQKALPVNERSPDLETRMERLGELEAELATLNTSSLKDDATITRRWTEVKFTSDAIAIEFSRFNFYNPNKTDTILYVAYLYKRSWKTAKAIPLFEEKELKAILNVDSPNKLYVSRGSQGSSTSNVNNANKLYELIWKPLESHLEGMKTIYFSPDGLLHKVAFSTLSYNKGKSLSEQFNLVQLGTTGSIDNEKKEPNKQSVVLFGGIDYEHTSTTTEGSGPLVSSEISLVENGSRGNSSGWNYLEGTLQEVNGIGNLVPSAEIITGSKATEDYFKALSGKSPSVLHIATHGFFFEDAVSSDNESLVYKASNDPLLRSGLLLSGANVTWKNGKKPVEGEDGILTALEISNLDLSKTDMVVLSACDTGLGEIQGSEGVFGLQRAFKLAGVDIIIMSLWQVPDKETAEFMELLYSTWNSGIPIREAFRQTQLTMQQRYKDEPLKWAAFVLVE